MTDSDEADNAPLFPEFDVWNHLDSGWQMAFDDLKRTVDSDVLTLVQDIAHLVYGAQRRLIVPMDSEWLRGAAKRLLPTVTEVDGEKIIRATLAAMEEGRLPLVRYAVELEVASEGIGRANRALSRASLLKPMLGARELPERARRYLEDAVGTFLFGFDAACIAFCCSAFEQLGRHKLIQAGIWSEAHVRKSKPTAFTVLADLERATPPLLTQSRAAADSLVRRRNQNLHSHLYDERILKQSAVDSIDELLQVARELYG